MTPTDILVNRADLEAILEALLTARNVIEQEANSRAAGCDPTSAYEREPIEAIALIDAVLVKVDHSEGIDPAIDEGKDEASTDAKIATLRAALG